MCDPETVQTTRIPNEAVSDQPVPVLREIRIPDVCEALLEQERLGTLVIQRHGELTDKMRDWVQRVEADIIREKGLMGQESPMAEYYRSHYPESWALVAAEKSI